ncbi:hypothetical protein IFM89_004398 [Coptis chinensis]|uniref:Uncharacterized protein n=1 Tax=Coptis chinensis TaxID=261450 RepID=A0A835IHG7_9MAGN|nr:hypothetical protein IFM89_004398 [Coptis chinensis]
MEGALARSKVPLSEFETWHDLPEPLRDDLWEAIWEGDGDFDASEKARNNKKSRKQVKDAGILKTKKTPTNQEFSTPKEGDGDFDAPEKARNDKQSNKQGVKCSLALTLKSNIVDKGLVFKNTRPQETINDIPLGEANFQVQIDTEKEETLDEMEHSIREYGDMLDNTMESSDNIVIPIERELFREDIELCHFSIEKSYLFDICSMDWLSVSCMTTYMKYLYGSFMSSKERYTFANPSNFTNYGNDDGEKVQHLQHR